MNARLMAPGHPAAIALFTLIALTTACERVAAQGFLVNSHPGRHWRLPRPIRPPHQQPSTSYRIASLEVNARLRDAVAEVQVSQTFENTGGGVIEACFVFPLPYDGAVDELTLLVDGKEYAAKLLSREEARRRYEEIVRTSRDPALLEWLARACFRRACSPFPRGRSGP